MTTTRAHACTQAHTRTHTHPSENWTVPRLVSEVIVHMHDSSFGNSNASMRVPQVMSSSSKTRRWRPRVSVCLLDARVTWTGVSERHRVASRAVTTSLTVYTWYSASDVAGKRVHTRFSFCQMSSRTRRHTGRHAHKRTPHIHARSMQYMITRTRTCTKFFVARTTVPAAASTPTAPTTAAASVSSSS